MELPSTHPRNAVHLQQSHHRPMTLDKGWSERLGETIGWHPLGRRVLRLDGLLLGDLIPDPEVLNWDVLHVTMMYCIVEHLDRRLVVEMKGGWNGNSEADFTEKVLKPTNFCACECCSVELCLC